MCGKYHSSSCLQRNRLSKTLSPTLTLVVSIQIVYSFVLYSHLRLQKLHWFVVSSSSGCPHLFSMSMVFRSEMRKYVCTSAISRRYLTSGSSPYKTAAARTSIGRFIKGYQIAPEAFHTSYDVRSSLISDDVNYNQIVQCTAVVRLP